MKYVVWGLTTFMLAITATLFYDSPVHVPAESDVEFARLDKEDDGSYPLRFAAQRPRLIQFPRRTFELAKTYHYEYDSKRFIKMAPSHTTGSSRAKTAKQNLVEQLHANIQMTPLIDEVDIVHIRVILKDFALQRPGLADSAPLHRQVSEPFVVSMAHSGLVEAIHMPAEWSSSTRSLIKSIVASMQLVRSNSSRFQWTSQEQDVMGTYVASYDVAMNALGKAEIRKTKGQYLNLTTILGLKPTGNSKDLEVRSQSNIELDEYGWPSRWIGHETMKVNMPNIAFDSVYEQTITLLGRTNFDDSGYGPIWDRLEPTELVGTEELGGARHQLDLNSVAGASLGELLDALDSAMDLEREDRIRAAAHLYVRIAASLRLRPEHADELVRRIRVGDSPEIMQILAGALSDAGTPQAQKALVDLIMASEANSEQRLVGLVALGMTKNPSTHTLDTALDLSRQRDGDIDDELRDTATLALGNIIQQRKRDGIDDGKTLVEELVAQLQAADGDDEKTLYLLALGNTGSRYAFAAIDALAATPGPLQETALQSLRFIPLPDVDERLSLALMEGMPPVKMAALSTVEFRATHRYWPLLIDLMQRETEIPLRRAIVTLAGRYQRRHAQAKALLVEAAEADVDAEIRAMARRYISSI